MNCRPQLDHTVDRVIAPVDVSYWQPRRARLQLSQSFIRSIPYASIKLSFPLQKTHTMQRKPFRRRFSEPIWR